MEAVRSYRKKMHQTTVRFGEDLWHELEAESERLGVSVAQYVRDAALRRLSYEAGRRDEVAASGNVDASAESAGDGETGAAAVISESVTLWAQGRQARQRAAKLRAQAAERRSDLRPRT